MGRQARLIDLDPRYVDVIVKRWQGYTGRAAVLEKDGLEFEQIAFERSEFSTEPPDHEKSSG